MLLAFRGVRGVNIIVLTYMQCPSEASISILAWFKFGLLITPFHSRQKYRKSNNQYTYLTSEKAALPVDLVMILDRSPKNLVVLSSSDRPFLHIQAHESSDSWYPDWHAELTVEIASVARLSLISIAHVTMGASDSLLPFCDWSWL